MNMKALHWLGLYELSSHMCSVGATPGRRLVLLYLVAIQALIDCLALHIIYPCAHPATHPTLLLIQNLKRKSHIRILQNLWARHHFL